MSSWWMSWVAGGSVVAFLAGLRWALADFLLDQFGPPPDSVSRAVHPEGAPVTLDRSETLQSSSRREAVER